MKPKNEQIPWVLIPIKRIEEGPGLIRDGRKNEELTKAEKVLIFQYTRLITYPRIDVKKHNDNIQKVIVALEGKEGFNEMIVLLKEILI